MRTMRTAPMESERRRRHITEVVRLKEDLRTLLALRRDVVEETTPEGVLEIAKSRYLGGADVGIVTVGLKRGPVTLVAVPRRKWHDPSLMARVFTLKRAARSIGIFCVLVPQATVRRQPRLRSAQILRTSAREEISVSDRMRILAHLGLEPGSTLEDCAALITSRKDPFAAVLSLVNSGEVEFDTGRDLSPFTSLYVRGT